MGIIKWWNDRWNKPEGSPSVAEKPTEVVQDKPILSDFKRISRYVEDGGEVVDLSNKPRLPNDGFPIDEALQQPWNEAHAGTKAGLSALMKGGKR